MADSSMTAPSDIPAIVKTFAKEKSRARVNYAATVKSARTFVQPTARKSVKH